MSLTPDARSNWLRLFTAISFSRLALEPLKLETPPIGFVCTTGYRLPATGYSLLASAYLVSDVSAVIYFHHKKTLHDARVLTQKGRIPQEYFAAGPAQPGGRKIVAQ
jgi:hypothetical protein